MEKALKALFYWSKAKHLSLVQLKEDLLKQIEELQNKEANEGELSEEDSWAFNVKICELNSTLARLDTWSRQRAKVKWMMEGDRNSKFFQAYASARRNSNYIANIKDENGDIVEDQHQIEEVMVRFFKNKWRDRNCNLENWPFPWRVSKYGDRDVLNKAFTMQEME
ncbi:hypothetical protein KFK09_001899 [Dendrobium nobile]|uniref:RNA-directed DNA polymerase (Reverse transcriptase) n=1 Tax=Dendrobium nobile TaxID=94219 RepID=A0A8T3CBJ9_DENNO|nr:hypothetical protein KFK09_001899 [Dendrobium nobile]